MPGAPAREAAAREAFADAGGSAGAPRATPATFCRRSGCRAGVLVASGGFVLYGEGTK